MFDKYVCKIFGLETVTAQDIIRTLILSAIFIGLPCWAVIYTLLYRIPDTAVILGIWFSGIVLGLIELLVVMSVVYDMSAEVEVARYQIRK